MAMIDRSRDEDTVVQAVEMLQSTYDWRLLDHDIFVQEVMGLLARKPDMPARQAALQVYTEALHRACSGLDGQQRQERGYTELIGYLQRCAARYGPDIRADAIQSAVALIFLRFT